MHLCFINQFCIPAIFQHIQRNTSELRCKGRSSVSSGNIIGRIAINMNLSLVVVWSRVILKFLDVVSQAAYVVVYGRLLRCSTWGLRCCSQVQRRSWCSRLEHQRSIFSVQRSTKGQLLCSKSELRNTWPPQLWLCKSGQSST